ncbi:SDR family NAD(P)-dependent oxidoreductase [Novipirellula maiorica]|uniref:SDR family NAD(P)-dependent oxidoreductase n=1 Tax=Novipirellula maiorica TaxID=1265734 RepID=UPI0005926915|nr:SDR family NAD(P)-dependent oxidoreductase [Rhodopirellula maiorica]
MSRKILITGGAGCIGSDLAEALVTRGDHVTVLDNLSSGRLEHIEPLLTHDKFRFIQGDLLDQKALDAAMDSVEMVYHLAANPDVKFTAGDATDKDLKQNTLATYAVLETMRQQGVKKLAFSSTSAVYGVCETLPISEQQAPHPISLYGASKLACEGLIGSFQHLFDMQCWVFRFANIVGKKVRSRGRTVIADFAHKLLDDPSTLPILGNGKQAKSYLLSSECVEAMLFAIEHAKQPINTFNLGCSDWITVDRIAELMVEAMNLENVKFEYTGTEGGWAGDVPRFLLDVSAINQLGWQAKHNSEQAIRFAIKNTLQEINQTTCKP